MRCNLHDYDIMEEGKEQGIAIGVEQGRSEAKLEAARNMLMEGDSAEKIARCTDLTLETVQKLAEQLKVPAAQ